MFLVKNVSSVEKSIIQTEVAEQLEKMVNLAKQMMQEIAVLDYSKVA